MVTITRKRRCLKVKKNAKPFCISFGEKEIETLRKKAYKQNTSVAALIKTYLKPVFEENIK